MKLPFRKRETKDVEIARQIRADLEALQGDPEFMAEEILLDVNEQICVLMDQMGMNRSDLARTLGWSRGAVSKMLNGNHNISIARLAEVAAALRVKMIPPRFVSSYERGMTFPAHHLFYSQGDGGTRLMRNDLTTTDEARAYTSLPFEDWAA